MNDSNPQEERELEAQLTRAREQLGGLVQELRGVDGELEALAGERQQYRLLRDACGALQELETLGAAGLFWGERFSNGEAGAHLRQVLGRVDGFEKRIGEVEERRQEVADRVERAQEVVELVEEDLWEARRCQEERKQEWALDRSESGPWLRAAVMPWSHGGEDDERFRKSLAATMLLSLLLGLVLPQIPLPLPELGEPLEVPARLTRLISERRPPPPPPVQQQVAEEKPLEATKDTVEPAPKDAPKKTPSKGILAFREKFSGLANTPAKRLGAEARISNPGEVKRGLPTRSMVTTQAPGSSGGINLAQLSRDVGGGNGEIAGVEVARATSSIGGVPGEDRPLSDGAVLGRTDEEIQIVFDRHKAALYRLYNRELRRDPTLRGQMVLRLTIEPDGSVSLCQLHGSDMKAPELAGQVVARVRSFDFGAKEVPAVTILYPIDFLPAT